MTSHGDEFLFLMEVDRQLAATLGEEPLIEPEASPQSEIVAESGEPAVEVEDGSDPGSASPAPLLVASLHQAEILTAELKSALRAAEARAKEAENRARVAQGQVSMLKRTGAKIGGSALRTRQRNAGVVVVKVDGKNYVVKPGTTIDVSGGVVNGVTKTSAAKDPGTSKQRQ